MIYIIFRLGSFCSPPGIGKATALAILRYGANVFAVDFNEAALKEAFVGFDATRVKTAKLDVTDGAAVKALGKRLEQECGLLWGVVNSAGIALPPGTKRPTTKGAQELDVDTEVLPIINVNLIGTMRVNTACFESIWKSNSRTAKAS